MEVVYQIIFSCLVIVVVNYTWKIVNCVYLRPKKLEKQLQKQGFKGYPYKLVYGDLEEMSSTNKEGLSKIIKVGDDIKPRTFAFIHKSIEKYGNLSYFWFGQTPTIIVTDAELIKEVFQNYVVFQKPKRKNPLTKLFLQGLLNFEKEKWAKQRKLIHPTFHLEKLKLMVPAFCMSCEDSMIKWEDILSTTSQTEVDVWPYIDAMTSDAISRTAFGSSYQQGRRIFELQAEQARHFDSLLQSTYIPGSRFLPNKRDKRMKEIERETNTIIQGLIHKRLKAMEAGEASKDDLLGLLLESNSTEMKQNGDKSGMSIGDVVNECKLFYFAGQETTAALVNWALVSLSKSQEWQTRAREEVMRVFGNEKPTFEGLNQLKIVSMIVYEVLRLYPSVALLGREATEDTKLGKYTLLAGTRVVVPIVVSHHNPKVWGDDALEFNPQRFSEGVVKAQKTPGIYFPFGWGPRSCIAQNFALAEAKTMLVMMLQRFSFELSPSYKHAPYCSIATRPQFGTHLVMRKI